MTEEEETAALLRRFAEGVAELERQAKVLSDVRQRCIEAGIPAELLPTTAEDLTMKRGGV